MGQLYGSIAFEHAGSGDLLRCWEQVHDVDMPRVDPHPTQPPAKGGTSAAAAAQPPSKPPTGRVKRQRQRSPNAAKETVAQSHVSQRPFALNEIQDNFQQADHRPVEASEVELPPKLATAAPLQSIFFIEVAVVGNRYLSIVDGRFEFLAGRAFLQILPPKDDAYPFYLYRTPKAARGALYPDNSVLLDTPRAVLQILASGAGYEVDGKFLFEGMLTLQVEEWYND